MSTLEHQFVDTRTRFGERTATKALAEWISRDDPSAQLATMPAVVDNPARLTAGALTTEHIGSRVSFARVGTSGAGARVAGGLSGIGRTVRANGMPGYLLRVRGEEHGPFAPHHEVIVSARQARRDVAAWT